MMDARLTRMVLQRKAIKPRLLDNTPYYGFSLEWKAYAFNLIKFAFARRNEWLRCMLVRVGLLRVLTLAEIQTFVIQLPTEVSP